MKAPERFVICSDIHGKERDERPVKALLSFIRDFKPTRRIINGDLFDFANLRKGASDEEKAQSLAEDWEMGTDFASQFFSGGTLNHFNRGNHDERLWLLRDSASGILADYAADGVKRIEGLCRKWKASMLPYDAREGVYKLGDLNVVHGYFTGPHSAARHAATYGHSVFGHDHSVTQHTAVSYLPSTAMGSGCLCKKTMAYLTAKPGKLRHEWGWIYGFIFPNGETQCFQVKEKNAQFYAATQIQCF